MPRSREVIQIQTALRPVLAPAVAVLHPEVEAGVPRHGALHWLLQPGANMLQVRPPLSLIEDTLITVTEMEQFCLQ